MPLGDNIVSNISTYVQQINEAAYLVARDNNYMTPLVTTFSDNAGTAARTRSEYGTVTFNQITDADDLASQAFTPSIRNSLTPALFGAQFFITDQRLRSAPWDEMAVASRELGEGAAKHVNINLLSAFSSLTGGTAGAPGGTVTWSTVFKAIALLKAQKAPEPYFGVLHTGHWFHLGTAVVPAGAQTNAPDLQNQVLTRYFVGNFFNTLWFQTSDIASGTAAVGAVFSREALAFDLRKQFGIEEQRDASRGGGGWELNATMEYGAGVWRPQFGIQIVATSVIP